MKTLKFLGSIAMATILLSNCSKQSLSVEVQSFGRLSNGEEAHLFTITNSSGSSLSISDYGARIVSINIPDRNGKLGDVIIGHGDLSTFETGDRFMGCVLGRYGNRINNSSFVIDSVEYRISANELLDGNPVHLSGGSNGFDRFIWDSEVVWDEDKAGVRFSRMSPDGEEGYPGNCECTVTYWWNETDICKIVYEATSDKPTVINLSNHAYFNLKGVEGEYVMDHLLTVYADSCIQNNLQYCPEYVLAVDDTPFDFREPNRVDYRLDMPHEHLRIMRGMSACWKLRDFKGNRSDGQDGCIDSTAVLFKAADLYEPRCGRGMETWTTEPFILTYTGRGFNGSRMGKKEPIVKYSGMLFETIHAADSPNQDRFPSTILRPGEKYRTTTEFRFYTK